MKDFKKEANKPSFFVHETAIIDAPCDIGLGNKDLAFFSYHAKL